MTNDPALPSYASNDNVVEQAADAASDAVAVTRTAVSSALDAAVANIESVRSSLSPYIDIATQYTRKQPIKALAWSMTAGVVLAVLFRPVRQR